MLAGGGGSGSGGGGSSGWESCLIEMRDEDGVDDEVLVRHHRPDLLVHLVILRRQIHLMPVACSTASRK
jgi:hypothetical protein